MTHQLPEFPGTAKYPVDAWEAVGSPMLTTTKMDQEVHAHRAEELDGAPHRL